MVDGCCSLNQSRWAVMTKPFGPARQMRNQDLGRTDPLIFLRVVSPVLKTGIP